MRFDGLECYLATGFSVGYRGEGPTALAMFAAAAGFGEREELLKRVAGLPQDFQGILVAK